MNVKRFCPYCSKTFSSETFKFCPYCGRETGGVDLFQKYAEKQAEIKKIRRLEQYAKYIIDELNRRQNRFGDDEILNLDDVKIDGEKLTDIINNTIGGLL